MYIELSACGASDDQTAEFPTLLYSLNGHRFTVSFVAEQMQHLEIDRLLTPGEELDVYYHLAAMQIAVSLRPDRPSFVEDIFRKLSSDGCCLTDDFYVGSMGVIFDAKELFPTHFDGLPGHLEICPQAARINIEFHDYGFQSTYGKTLNLRRKVVP